MRILKIITAPREGTLLRFMLNKSIKSSKRDVSTGESFLSCLDARWIRVCIAYNGSISLLSDADPPFSIREERIADESRAREPVSAVFRRLFAMRAGQGESGSRIARRIGGVTSRGVPRAMNDEVGTRFEQNTAVSAWPRNEIARRNLPHCERCAPKQEAAIRRNDSRQPTTRD